MGSGSSYREKWFSVTWITVIFLAVCHPSHGTEIQIRGDEFYLAFMGMDSNQYSADSYRFAYAFITNPNSQVAQVTIEYLGFGGTNQLLNLASGQTVRSTLPNNVILSGTSVHQESARLFSDIDIIVQAAFEYNDGGQLSMAGYPVLPTSSLTSEYVAATHCYTNQCVFLVTAVDDNTSVTVHMRVANQATATYRGNSYADGDTFTEVLQKGESFQVTCYRCDMTGTLVRANGKLAVIGGGDFTKYGYNRGNQDAVAEQMLPKESLGQNYVLGNNYGDVIEIVKVVVLETGGSFTYNGVAQGASTKDRQLYTIPSAYSSNITVITSDRPLLVVQVMAGDTYAKSPDVSMVIAVPEFQWSTTYQVYLPFETAESSVYVSLVMHKDNIDHITTPGDTVSSLSIIYGSNYDLGTMGFQVDGSRLLTIQCLTSQCRPFTGFVVVNEDKKSSVFPILKSVYIHPTTEAEATTTEETTTQLATTPIATTEVKSTETTQLATTPIATTEVKSTETTQLATTPIATTEVKSTETTQLATTPIATTEVKSTETTQLATTPIATTEVESTETTQLATTPIATTEVESTETTQLATTPIATTEVESTETTQPATTPIATTEVESTETTQLATTPIATTEVESTETTQPATTPIATTEVESTKTSEAATVTQNNVSPAPSSTTSAFNNNWASRCNCRCLENVALTLANSTSQKAQQTEQQIQDDLLEDRKQLSSYIRSKTSAPDERKSALVVGSTVGIVVFTIVFCLVVLPDFLKVCWYLAMRFRDRSKQD